MYPRIHIVINGQYRSFCADRAAGVFHNKSLVQWTDRKKSIFFYAEDDLALVVGYNYGTRELCLEAEFIDDILEGKLPLTFPARIKLNEELGTPKIFTMNVHGCEELHITAWISLLDPVIPGEAMNAMGSRWRQDPGRPLCHVDSEEAAMRAIHDDGY